MKRNVFSFLVTVAVVAAVGFAVAGCKNQVDEADGGVLTVTGISAGNNGRWAIALVYDGPKVEATGVQSMGSNPKYVFSPIAGGQVSMPLWADAGKRWAGSVSSAHVEVSIMNNATGVSDTDGWRATATFDSVPFTGGNVTLDWTKGKQ